MGFIQQLRTKSLNSLIDLAQRDVADGHRAMNEIVSRFEPLTRSIARGMTRSRDDLFDDVANAARVALTRAVRRHDPARAGFPAYAEKFMRGGALRELQRWQQQAKRDADAAASFTTEVRRADVSNGGTLDHLAPWGAGAVAVAVGKLTPAQQDLLTRRYIDDASLDTIAVSSNTSVSAVSQRLSTIHRRVRLELAA